MDLYLYKFLIRENMALVALSVKALDADLNDPDFENKSKTKSSGYNRLETDRSLITGGSQLLLSITLGISLIKILNNKGLRLKRCFRPTMDLEVG